MNRNNIGERIGNDEWHNYAQCYYLTNEEKTDFHPPDKIIEFKEKGETVEEKQAREARAKAVCKQCVVKAHCLDFALNGEETGVWGGLNEEERENLKSRNQPDKQAS